MKDLLRRLAEVDWVAAAPILGGIIVFMIWGWRRNRAELEKLRLENDKLRVEASRIYKPTMAEIREIVGLDFRGKSGGGFGRMALSEEEVAYWEAVGAMRELFKLMLAARGDREAQKQVEEWKLLAPGRRGEEERDPALIYEKWRKARGVARRRLADETIDRIEWVLRTLVALQFKLDLPSR